MIMQIMATTTAVGEFDRAFRISSLMSSEVRSLVDSIINHIKCSALNAIQDH